MPSNTRGDEEEIDFLRLWTIIWSRRWNIFGLTLVVMMLAALIVLNMTPYYRAGATLLIEQRTPKVVSIDEVYGLESTGSEYLQTQFELLKSRELAERVVRELRLASHPEFDPSKNEKSFSFISRLFADVDLHSLLPFDLPDHDTQIPRVDEDGLDGVVDAFIERLKIIPVSKTQLVKIHVYTADPAIAADSANALAKAYIDSQLEAKLVMSKTATTWMNEQLSELKLNLQESEERLQQFREKENLVDIKGVTTVSADELSGTGSRLIDARRARAEAESQYRQVATVLERGDLDRLASVPAVLSDPLVQEFRAAEATARSKVLELQRRYGPKYPKMEAAQSDLDSATASLKAQIEEVVASIERKYQLALANEESLQFSFDENKGQIQNISRKEFGLRELQREVDANRELYDTFLSRLKETSATQEFDAVNARVVEKAKLPREPVKPQKLLIVLVSGVLALFITAGLSLLLETLNNTFKKLQDVENQLNLPALGTLPLVKPERGMMQQEQGLSATFQSDKDRAFSEAIRTLRTSVMLSLLDKAQKNILVTSSVPGEGKTTVASSLALSVGQMHKVLLIEADLRRPTLRKNFGLPVGMPGIANYLAQTATLAECLYHITDSVDLITAGAVPPNPQELLASHRFAEMITNLSEKYAYIIIDTPPVLAVSDAVLLSTLADSVIYVIKSLSTTIPMAQRGLGHLLQQNAPVSGAVLNQVDVAKAGKYGYNYGGYYDYYGTDQKT